MPPINIKNVWHSWNALCVIENSILWYEIFNIPRNILLLHQLVPFDIPRQHYILKSMHGSNPLNMADVSSNELSGFSPNLVSRDERRLSKRMLMYRCSIEYVGNLCIGTNNSTLKDLLYQLQFQVIRTWLARVVD